MSTKGKKVSLVCFCCRLVRKSCLTLATPSTVAHHTPLFMGFSRQEYWSGLPFPLPGESPTQGSNPGLLLDWQILNH